jgi:hypothetical protein
MSESENKNLVVRLFESLSTGDIDAALELMDNDAVYWVCGKPKQFPLAGTYTEQQFAAVPDTVARATPNAMTASITATTACMRTDNVHLPELLSVPGFVSAVRFRQLGAEGHYLAMYEIDHPRVFSEPRYAQITGWGEWAPVVTAWSRSVYVIDGELPVVNYVPRAKGAASDEASGSGHRQETHG